MTESLDRNPAAEGAAADAIVAALRSALRGRLDSAAREVLRGFESSRGRPTVPVDEDRVAQFVRRNWTAVRGLLQRPHAQVRQAALWALATDRSARVAGPILELLLDQRHMFDHDYAYVAARRVGAPLVPPLERAALRGSGLRRKFAIHCLGSTRAGRPAVAALRRIVRRHGFGDGVLNALYNVHHAEAIALAAGALDDPEPNVRLDAMGAVLAGLEAKGAPLAASRRSSLVRRVLRAMEDPQTWQVAQDPWASLFGFGLEVLQHLDPAAARDFALRCAANGAHPEVLDELRPYLPKRRRGAK